MEKAIRRIPAICPEWTNFNEHDPGITILELFAWLKEMQQFHMEQTAKAQTRKYLARMGFTPGGVCSSRAVLRIDGLKETVFFPAKSRFFAGDVCFESTKQTSLEAALVAKLIFVPKQKQCESVSCYLSESGLHFPAFGMQPAAGDMLRIGLTAPLAPQTLHSLYIGVAEDAKAKRNPIGDFPFFALAEYRILYRTGTDDREAICVRDTTNQLLNDGFLTFSTEEEMEKAGDGLYWLALKLARSEYDIAPVIKRIGFSFLSVRQKLTSVECHEISPGQDGTAIVETFPGCVFDFLIFCKKPDGFYRYDGEVCRNVRNGRAYFRMPGDCAGKEDAYLVLLFDVSCRDQILLGEGNGMPYQQYRAGISHLDREGIVILAESGPGSGCYHFWEARDDFDASGPTDRHFCFDEESGIVSFGDCDHGMAPGGHIFLAGAYSCLGAGGNAAAEKISRADLAFRCAFEEKTVGADSFQVINEREAVGGRNRETLEDCRKRMFLSLREKKRAVTYEDYETLIKQTPGLMIENVRAIPITELADEKDEQTISVVVRPFAKNERAILSDAYKRNIWRMAESIRMIGTKVRILAPEYIGVDIFAEIKASAARSLAEKQAKEAIGQFFSKIKAEFGCVIRYSALYGHLDVQDGVAGIKTLKIKAAAGGIGHSQNGDIFLPVNALPCLKECTILVTEIS